MLRAFYVAWHCHGDIKVPPDQVEDHLSRLQNRQKSIFAKIPIKQIKLRILKSKSYIICNLICFKLYLVTISLVDSYCIFLFQLDYESVTQPSSSSEPAAGSARFLRKLLPDTVVTNVKNVQVPGLPDVENENKNCITCRMHCCNNSRS